MQVHDHIFHLRVIDSALGSTAPCLFSGLIVREIANGVDLVQILKFKTLRVLNAAAEYQMHFAHKQDDSRTFGSRLPCEAAISHAPSSSGRENRSPCVE